MTALCPEPEKHLKSKVERAVFWREEHRRVCMDYVKLGNYGDKFENILKIKELHWQLQLKTNHPPSLNNNSNIKYIINRREEQINRNLPTDFKKIRISSNKYECAGRVEVLYNGTWGSVCVNSITAHTANVICQNTGCGESGYFETEIKAEESSGPKWLDYVQCLQHQNIFWQCSSSAWGQNNCKQGEEAVISCSGKEEKVIIGNQSRCSGPLFDKSCASSLHLKLAGGNSNCLGRVEVWYNDSWGTVCDDSWDMNDAEVVCRQLNCGNAVAIVSEAAFGEGSGPIWLDDVHCAGFELLLHSCTSRWVRHDCSHKEDAGVICSGMSFPLVLFINNS
ncbi:antigen WC1.1-like [Protopterus annectens]|uniref:antigen WC1.1-like n=1 Tax=Protopterus annectens TaxID=7888 RepID=UPI001CFB0B34|nr:antigen WC1.1-like [Protopterus annectens]